MDLTYTDPSYLPVYSLDGISESLLEVTTFLMQLNVKENHLRSLVTLLCHCQAFLKVDFQTSHLAMLTGSGLRSSNDKRCSCVLESVHSLMKTNQANRNVHFVIVVGFKAFNNSSFFE